MHESARLAESFQEWRNSGQVHVDDRSKSFREIVSFGRSNGTQARRERERKGGQRDFAMSKESAEYSHGPTLSGPPSPMKQSVALSGPPSPMKQSVGGSAEEDLLSGRRALSMIGSSFKGSQKGSFKGSEGLRHKASTRRVSSGMAAVAQGSGSHEEGDAPEKSKSKNHFSLRVEGMRAREFKFFGMQGNPVVVLATQAIIWALVITAIVDPASMFESAAGVKREITRNFTWLYIASQNLWVAFIVYLWFSPAYSNLKLGNKDDEPEFSTISWFMMMFMSAGAGTGLIYYGVGEPIYHLSYNRYVSTGNMNYNELSQQAMNLTYYHWGVHAWMCYTMFAIVQGIVSHRMGLPLTIRSCFFPIFGSKIYGWFGDAVDTLSLISTVFGICTTMGIGAVQLNTGLNRLNNSVEKSILVQVFLIAIMTILGGISAHAGLRRGVRNLSIAAFLFITVVMFMVLVVDHTTFLLNFITQSFGHHLHHFIQLSFHTDAFEQLDGGVDSRAGPSVWMDWWTIFYWGWWVSWSPFVGLFIARISKGRTIKEIINASITGPVVYTFVWFGIFGGAGLRMERNAIIDACLGSCSVTSQGRQFLRKYCDSVASLTTDALEARTASFLLRRPEGCQSIVQLSTVDLDEMWFEVLEQYKNVNGMLIVISIISMILFFITTNDSGSIILDLIGTSGKTNSSPVQKQMWSFTLGATAIALLIAGGSRSLTALQTVLNAIGLPMTILITSLCLSLKAGCEMEVHEDTIQHLTVAEGRFDNLFDNDNGFEFWQTSMLGGIFDTFEFILSLGKVRFPSLHHWTEFTFALFCPWFYLGKTQAMVSELETGKPINVFGKGSSSEVRMAQMTMASSAVLFYMSVIFWILEVKYENFWVIGISTYFLFTCIVATVRGNVRRLVSIYGDSSRDLAASFCAYPLCIAQMHEEIRLRTTDVDSETN